MRSWNHIILQMGLERYMTSSVREDFEKMKVQQGGMDLTRENIQQLILMLFQNSDSILNNAVIDVFDVFTQYHKNNRTHIEGWKTNSAWKVNRKVILPNFTTGGYDGFYGTTTYKYNQYSDIDRAMCFLTGTKYESLDQKTDKHSISEDRSEWFTNLSLDKAIKSTKYGDSSIQESMFFNFRCYQKGTVHLTFKSEDLWAKFNQVACEGKFNLGEK